MNRKREIFFSLTLFFTLGAAFIERLLADETTRLIACGGCIILSVIFFFFGMKETLSRADSEKVSNLDSLHQQAQEQIQQIERLSDGMNQCWLEMQKNLERIEKDLMTFEAHNHENRQQSLVTINSTLTELVQQTEKLPDIVTKQISPLGQGLDALQSGINSLQSATADRMSSLDQNQGQNMEALRSGLTDCISSLEQSLGQRLEALRSETTEGISSLERSQGKNLGDLCEELEEILSRQTATIRNNGQDLFDNLDRKLDDQQKLNKRAQNQNSEFQLDLLEKLDKQISATEALRSSFVQQSEENRDQLTHMTKQYSEVTDKDIQVLEQLLGVSNGKSKKK